jgi:hypothetical protein
MSTPTKLPAGLPKLPPVPDGYSRWEYKGRKWSDVGYHVYAFADERENSWCVYDVPMRPAGGDWHYIVAVRDAKPAKKATKKKAKRVKVRTQIAYADTDLGEISTDWAVISEGHHAPKCDPVRVLVIPFDAPSREAIVSKAALAVDYTEQTTAQIARAVLSALHPDFAKEGR